MVGAADVNEKFTTGSPEGVEVFTRVVVTSKSNSDSCQKMLEQRGWVCMGFEKGKQELQEIVGEV